MDFVTSCFREIRIDYMGDMGEKRKKKKGLSTLEKNGIFT